MNLGTSFRTDAATRGQRLDQALVARFPALSRTKLQELIKTGRVQIGGAVVRKPGMILIEECEISVGFDRNAKRKKVMHDGSEIPRLSDALGALPCVLFSPASSSTSVWMMRLRSS